MDNQFLNDLVNKLDSLTNELKERKNGPEELKEGCVLWAVRMRNLKKN